ncbi:Serine/threonine-protein kinase PknD [Streptomyces sp. RB17]|nr:Serine/threonine-protein kinase PknD [Streptomyces sp. RB17]
MGAVFIARTRGGRAVAPKVAEAELAADPSFRERLRSEVEAARAVGGFHPAPVVDADVDGEPPWLATAWTTYIPGPSLAARLAAQGAMDEPQLRALAAALAEALESIHSCGLVHRDIKPGNIIMAEDGPRVLDFGIARAVESTRLTATGTAFGTPGFLAPEQALGHDVTGAADVFALGAVLAAATGGSAWGEGTPMGLMYRSVHEPPNVSAVPAALVDLVSACLATDPAARPTPTEVLDRLTALPQYPAQPAVPSHTPTLAAPAQPLTPPQIPATPWTPPHFPATPTASPHMPSTPSTPSYFPAASSTPPHMLPAPSAAPPQVPYGFGPPMPYGAPEAVLADRESGIVVDATGGALRNRRCGRRLRMGGDRPCQPYALGTRQPAHGDGAVVGRRRVLLRAERPSAGPARRVDRPPRPRPRPAPGRPAAVQERRPGPYLAWACPVLGTDLLPGAAGGRRRQEEGVMDRRIRVRVSRRPAAPRGQEIDRRTPSGRILPY